MTAVTAVPPTSAESVTHAPTFSRLLRTELRRLFSRRFTLVLLAICAIGYLAAIGYTWQSKSQVTAADIAQATAQRDRTIADITASINNCLKAAGATAEQCGTVPTTAEFPPDQFLANNPFRPEEVSGYTTAVGVAVGMAAFVLAATFIGAEWSSKNLVAWLFYEPRRLRLMAAKLLALLGVVVVLSAVAQTIWAVSARLLIDHRGVPVSTLGDAAPHFWSDVLQSQFRSALLVVPFALLGFGLANLIKNTAAALGVAFVFLVVVESVLRAVSRSLQQFQITTNVAAWISPGGITVYGDNAFDPAQNAVMPKEIHISNLHGGVTLMIYAAVVLGVSLVMFRRRDIT